MKNNDAQLIQRVLDGDDTAFSALVKKYQRSVACTRMAEGRRFPYRRGYHTGYFPKSVSETLNAEGATVLSRVGCMSSPANHCKSVASEEADVDSVVGRHKQRTELEKATLLWTHH